ncbi:hypothetical protein [Thioalkalivibrio thiocyanodenitrificans]|uniref:hypothetical protein n=1 Tax=Thioalkalivibrio thiocyanodenitrificans TaxID=243063 RepID=UPI0003751CC4|nr:hypothetical protein [Thioalkalivibrio thiocyanodenitrificans]
MKPITHTQLCELATRWLKRPQSAGGPGCRIAFSEARSGHEGEIPDAIGFRYQGGHPLDGSTVVEVKVTRGDFLADRRKPHRNGDRVGLGRWRYYLCPQGVITPDDLPDGWGLLLVTSRGGIKAAAGPAAQLRYHNAKAAYGEYEKALLAMQFERSVEGELFLMTEMLSRVGDPEALNQRLRAAEGANQRILRDLDRRGEKIRALKTDLSNARFELNQVRKQIAGAA